MNPDDIAENLRSHERLAAILEGLSDQDLNRTLPNGWTVAMALFHLAFWDRYALGLIAGWEKPDYSPFPSNADVINEALDALWPSLPPHLSIEMARNAAEEVDRTAAAASEAAVAAIEAAGFDRILRRHLHRTLHLNHIEQALRGLAG